MTLNPFRNLSMQQQVPARLLLSLVVSALIMSAAGWWILRIANQRVGEHRAERAVAHITEDLHDLELAWGREAHALKARLEYSRVLEAPLLRQERFYSFMTAQGAALDFPVAFVADRSGQPLFGYTRGQEPLPMLRYGEGQDITWHFDRAANRLYRAYRQSVWLGNGNAHLVLLRPVDHAVLLRASAPEMDLAIFLLGRAVASSAGEPGLVEATAVARGGSGAGVRFVSWDRADPGGPQLMIRIRADNVLTVAELLMPLVGGLTVFLIVAWGLIGRWMLFNMARMAALERGTHGFVQTRKISGSVRSELDAASSGVRDELARLATSLEYLMHDVIAHEVELRESEQRYRFLIEGGSLVAWEFDPSRDAFAFVSPYAETLFGYSLELWMRPGFISEFVVPEDRGAAVGILRCTGGAGEVCRNEFRVRARDGRILWVEDISSPAESVDGRTMVRGVMLDISGRKAAEERLALAGMVFDSAAEGIMVTDGDDRIVLVNPAFEQITGYAAAEVIGAYPSILSSGRQDKEFFREFWNRLKREGHWRGEVENRRKDGTVYVQRTSASTVSDARGKIMRRVMLFSDITEERRKEGEIRDLNATLERRVIERTKALDDSNRQLRDALDVVQRAQQDLVRSEKLAGLGSLVAGVAHEMNTPIGNCLTVASALTDRTREMRALVDAGHLKRSDLADFMAAAESASQLLTRSMERAHELVSTFKQVAVDQTSEKRRTFDLAEVVEENINMLRPGYKHSPHKIESRVPQGISMDSYPGPLGQVIVNLVGNAMKHAFEGVEAGSLTVDAKTAGDFVTLTFRDDGIGMSDDVRQRAFDPFFTTKFGHGGSGLGLHIVFNLVTGVLGGTVDLKSAPGEGSAFAVTIPLVAPASPTPVSA
jgi:PAS domain S-box-containing protein